MLNLTNSNKSTLILWPGKILVCRLSSVITFTCARAMQCCAKYGRREAQFSHCTSSSVVYSYRVYKQLWSPTVGKVLQLTPVPSWYGAALTMKTLSRQFHANVASCCLLPICGPHSGYQWASAPEHWWALVQLLAGLSKLLRVHAMWNSALLPQSSTGQMTHKDHAPPHNSHTPSHWH